jgi:hypothetical protein
VRIIVLRLLCAIAWASSPVPPPQVPTSPDIEVISAKVTMTVFKSGGSPQPDTSSDTIGREGKANDPMPVIVPNPNVSAKPIERQFSTYSAVIRNRGQKEIKRLIWSFVFSDPVTHEELKRERGFMLNSISPGQKKTLTHRSASSPPRVINANSPKPASPFDQRVIVECVLYADGSLWESPEGKLKVIARATGQLTDLCENLAR